MIELLLAAERLLARGEMDAAGRLFEQVAEADPRNAIAVVGLARVAERRGDRDAAATLARRALDIDPDDPAAAHLLETLSASPSVFPEPLAGPVAAPSPPVSAPRPWWRRLLAFVRGG
jgi:predicted TPR repeat methyltransferase